MSNSPQVLYDLRPMRTPISGVARHAVDLLHALKENTEFEFSALYRGDASTNPILAELGSLPAPMVSTPNHNLLNIVLEYAPLFSPLVVKGKYDLVHETFFFNAYTNRGVKKVATIHDVIPLEFPEYFTPRNNYFTKRNFYRQAKQSDHIFADSVYTKTKILEFAKVDESRITIVPLGYTPKKLSIVEGYLDSIGLAGKRYIMFVGNVEPRKNVAMIAEALKNVGPKADDVIFVLAGHKNFQAEPILAECREHLGDRVQHLGFISEDEKWTLLKSAEAFVFASHYEGFGIPVVECYNARCPILIADNSSLSELVVDEHQRFDSHSVASLTARLSDLLDRPAWVAHSVEQGFATIPRYSYETIAATTADVYRKVLGS